MKNALKVNWLNEIDLANLIRFKECCEDSDADGHDVFKADMKRLAELGAVQNLGFGRHGLTSFGEFVVATYFDQSYKLPLKTISEHNAAAALKAKK